MLPCRAPGHAGARALIIRMSELVGFGGEDSLPGALTLGDHTSGVLEEKPVMCCRRAVQVKLTIDDGEQLGLGGDLFALC